MYGSINKKNKNNALQAQVYDYENRSIFHRIMNAIKIPSLCQEIGSATVEASLVLPFFLCALCTVCVIGQFLIAEASICHGTIQTARVYAKQESALLIKKDYKDKQGQEGKNELVQFDQEKTKEREEGLKNLGGILKTNVIFHSYVDKKEVDSNYVPGGKKGVILTPKKDKDFVNMQEKHFLKVPVPFFRGILLKRSFKVQCRLFTGYLPDLADYYSSSGNADQVYVTKSGNVYHTHLDCYHLSVCIKDLKTIEEILYSSHYKKCRKCMKPGRMPTEIYVTKEGDCYHSSLNCSGLKREVGIVNKNTIPGMRECSECAKH